MYGSEGGEGASPSLPLLDWGGYRLSAQPRTCRMSMTGGRARPLSRAKKGAIFAILYGPFMTAEDDTWLTSMPQNG